MLCTCMVDPVHTSIHTQIHTASEDSMSKHNSNGNDDDNKEFTMMIQSLSRALLSTFLVAWAMKKVHRNIFSLLLSIGFTLTCSIILYNDPTSTSTSTTSFLNEVKKMMAMISASITSIHNIIIEFQHRLIVDVVDVGNDGPNANNSSNNPEMMFQSLLVFTIIATLVIALMKHVLKLQFLSWTAYVCGYMIILPLYSMQHLSGSGSNQNQQQTQFQEATFIPALSYYLAIVLAYVGPISSRGAALFVTFEYLFTVSRILLNKQSSENETLFTEYEYRTVEAGVVAAFATLFYDLVLILLLPVLGRMLHVSCHVYGTLLATRTAVELMRALFPKSLRPVDHSVIFPLPGSQPLSWNDVLDFRNAFNPKTSENYLFVQLPPLIFIVYSIGVTLRIAMIASSGVTARDVDIDTNEENGKSTILARSQNLNLYAIAVAAVKGEKNTTKVLMGYAFALIVLGLFVLGVHSTKGPDFVVPFVSDPRLAASISFLALLCTETLIGDLTLTRKSLLQIGSSLFNASTAANPDRIVNPLATSGVFDWLIFEFMGLDRESGSTKSAPIMLGPNKPKHRRSNLSNAEENMRRGSDLDQLRPGSTKDGVKSTPPKADPGKQMREAEKLLKEADEAKKRQDALRQQLFRFNAMINVDSTPEAAKQRQHKVHELQTQINEAEAIYNEKYRAGKEMYQKASVPSTA